MRRGADLAEPEVDKLAQHLHAGREIGGSVVEPRQDVAMKVDVVRHVAPAETIADRGGIGPFFRGARQQAETKITSGDDWGLRGGEYRLQIH